MKKLIFTPVFALLVLFSPGSLHQFTVPLLEGGQQSLAVLSGKKVLLVTLPLQQSASSDSLLYSLDTLAAAHSNELKVLGVPAYEDGYTPAIKTELLQWYRSRLGSNILVTDGLYTRKTSGSMQHPLFNWLTHEQENGIFDVDVAGPGYKFITNESGSLYGVLHPQAKMHGRLVQKTLNMQ